MSSRTRKTPRTHATCVQPSKIAKASVAGIATAIQTPAYGIKRSSVPSSPHSIALGMPISHSAAANGTPKQALTTSCM
jgi:hypothetical protein